MREKSDSQKKYDKLVALTAEGDQRKARTKEIIDSLRAAIASGDYSLEQAKADIKELGFPLDESAEYLAMLEEEPSAGN
jgi:DNA-binding PadR family transcriptional regulator